MSTERIIRVRVKGSLRRPTLKSCLSLMEGQVEEGRGEVVGKGSVFVFLSHHYYYIIIIIGRPPSDKRWAFWLSPLICLVPVMYPYSVCMYVIYHICMIVTKYSSAGLAEKVLRSSATYISYPSIYISKYFDGSESWNIFLSHIKSLSSYIYFFLFFFFFKSTKTLKHGG